MMHVKFENRWCSGFREVDLNARVDVNFVRADVKFQTVNVPQYHYSFFFCFRIDIIQHQGPTYKPYKISAKYNKTLKKK